MFFDIPVTPGEDEAREWVIEELRKPVYNQGESLLDRLFSWLINSFAETFDFSSTSGVLTWPVVIALLAGAAVVAAWLLAGPIRMRIEARRAAASAPLTFDPRSQAEISQSALEAAAQGDWNTALLERFRAIIASFEERGILDAREGRTAFEAARDGSAVLGAWEHELIGVSVTFDSVFYGRKDATEAQYLSATTLATALEKAHRATQVEAT